MSLMVASRACYPVPANFVKKVNVERFTENPLISMNCCKSVGGNVNGPSVIKTPEWIKDPLGRYYMYFAHHRGERIKLAYADDIRGPWKIYKPGTLRLSQTNIFTDHIASPDVHVDEERKEIVMFFHGMTMEGPQMTCAATSSDGIHFRSNDQIVGNFYFRVFKWNSATYAIAKNGFISGELLCSENGYDKFRKKSNIILKMRHAAVTIKENILFVFYTRTGDSPERIFLSTMILDNEVNCRKLSDPIEVLRPETEYEGISCPLKPSKLGSAVNVCQVRDPYVFCDEGKTYLFYSIAGEAGIAGAELVFETM